MSDNMEKTNLGGEHELLLRLAENCASKQNGLHITMARFDSVTESVCTLMVD